MFLSMMSGSVHTDSMNSSFRGRPSSCDRIHSLRSFVVFVASKMATLPLSDARCSKFEPKSSWNKKSTKSFSAALAKDFRSASFSLLPRKNSLSALVLPIILRLYDPTLNTCVLAPWKNRRYWHSRFAMCVLPRAGNPTMTNTCFSPMLPWSPKVGGGTDWGVGLSSAASVNDDPPWVFRLDRPSELVPAPGEVDTAGWLERSDGDWLKTPGPPA
mmetsp:Transcript_4979/g.20518  ORF Transcript_4979/g.20518 Transcript_4979/m.20518 type:complete len:215 (-) Transcript_4979:534-1178(-)